MTASIWTTWSLQPATMAMVAGSAWLYGRGLRMLWLKPGLHRGVSGRRAAAFFGGLAAVVAALLSPVDAASDTYLWVHMVQHILLILVAAPLLILGRPVLVLTASLPAGWRAKLRRIERRPAVAASGRALTWPAGVWILHVAVLWGWHVPRAFDGALADPLVHMAEHATFLLTALLFWWLALEPGEHRRLPRGGDVMFVLGAWLATGALGAMFALAPSPIYAPYVLAARTHALSALADQQYAGLIMWIPAGLVYLAAACLMFVRWLQASERAMRRAEGRDTPSGRVRAASRVSS